MKVYQGFEEFGRIENAVVTIGTFDGVHAGHQKIISRLVELAAENNGETVLLTFFPHPRLVLQPDDNDLKLITTMSERIELLHRFGIHHLIIQPFSKEFSRLTATEFVRDILIEKIGTRMFVIGYDHHFGRNREGSFKDLEEMSTVYDYALERIPEQDVNAIAVSSTKIRTALLTGDIAEANALLAHDFSLSGKVIDGDKIGRSIGFPTANISIAEPYKLIPAEGIYAVCVMIENKMHKGMLYIGMRPTVNGKMLSIEVNLFDFDRNIYNQNITIYFKARIRGDMRFRNMELLKEKMKEDKIAATKILE